MRRAFLDHIELWLSAAGIGVILAVPALAGASGGAAWRLAAIAATSVGLIHGLIFWVVRRRQRETRREVIDEIRAMLSDRVNNNLTVISITLSEVDAREGTESLAELGRAVDRISELVTTLSHESVQSWKDRYGAFAPPAPRVSRPG